MLFVASFLAVAAVGECQTGGIEYSEAATEVVAAGGREMRIGGATHGINQVTRRIPGHRDQQSSSESSFTLTATIQ